MYLDIYSDSYQIALEVAGHCKPYDFSHNVLCLSVKSVAKLPLTSEEANVLHEW